MGIIGDWFEDTFSELKYKIEDGVSDFKEHVNEITLKVEEFAEGVDYNFKLLDEMVRDTKEDLTDIAVTGRAASDIVSDANSIIYKTEERYDSVYKQINNELLSINQMRENVFNEKKCIARLLNEKCHLMVDIPETIPSYQEKRPSYEKIEDILPQIFHIPFYKSTLGSIAMTTVNIIKSKERVSNADRYMESAKDYEVKVDSEIAKLHKMEAAIYEIQNILNEEKELLNMIRITFKVEKDYDNKKIADNIRILLSEPVLSENGKENIKYIKAVNDLKIVMDNY